VRAGVERRWLATTTLRTTGAHEVRFVVTGASEPPSATIEVARASNAPRRATEPPRTTVVPTAMTTTPTTPATMTTITMTTSPDLPPPIVVEDDGIDWSIPSNMGATMTATPTPPVDPAPPPWTG
jgi:hypothetical protein